MVVLRLGYVRYTLLLGTEPLSFFAKGFFHLFLCMLHIYSTVQNVTTSHVPQGQQNSHRNCRNLFSAML